MKYIFALLLFVGCREDPHYSTITNKTYLPDTSGYDNYTFYNTRIEMSDSALSFRGDSLFILIKGKWKPTKIEDTWLAELYTPVIIHLKSKGVQLDDTLLIAARKLLNEHGGKDTIYLKNY